MQTMASGGRGIPSLSHKTSNFTVSAPRAQTDAEFAKTLQREEEDMLYRCDRVTAQNLQEQYDRFRLYNDVATSRDIDARERGEVSENDEAFARDIHDNEMAIKLQVSRTCIVVC